MTEKSDVIKTSSDTPTLNVATPADVSKSRTRQDVKEIIKLVLNSPLKDGKVYTVDGKASLNSFNKKNVDVQTRMILQMSLNAIRGDQKAAEFLMHYGGFEPPREQHLTIETPTIIDDMSTIKRVEGTVTDKEPDAPVFIDSTKVASSARPDKDDCEDTEDDD